MSKTDDSKVDFLPKTHHLYGTLHIMTTYLPPASPAKDLSGYPHKALYTDFL